MLRAISPHGALRRESEARREIKRCALLRRRQSVAASITRRTDPKEIQHNRLSRWAVKDRTPARPSAAASRPSASRKRERRVSRASSASTASIRSRSAAPRRRRARALKCLSLRAAEPRYASQRVRRRMAKPAIRPLEMLDDAVRVNSSVCSA